MKTQRISGKLKAFEKNSCFFLKKKTRRLSKTQGFANSTWFLLRKNVKKISLHFVTLPGDGDVTARGSWEGGTLNLTHLLFSQFEVSTVGGVGVIIIFRDCCSWLVLCSTALDDFDRLGWFCFTGMARKNPFLLSFFRGKKPSKCSKRKILGHLL